MAWRKNVLSIQLTLQQQTFATATAIPTTFNQQGGLGLKAMIWFRLRNDGTSLWMDYSIDGSKYINLATELVGAFLTPTFIGWGGYRSVGSPATVKLYLDLLAYYTLPNANP